MRTWETAQFVPLKQIENKNMWLTSKGNNERDIQGKEKNIKLGFWQRRIDKIDLQLKTATYHYKIG